jgi:hypothetical protein
MQPGVVVFTQSECTHTRSCRPTVFLQFAHKLFELRIASQLAQCGIAGEEVISRESVIGWQGQRPTNRRPVDLESFP